MVVTLLSLAFMLIIRHSPSMQLRGLPFCMRNHYFVKLVEKGANLQKRGRGIFAPFTWGDFTPPCPIFTFMCLLAVLSVCHNIYMSFLLLQFVCVRYKKIEAWKKKKTLIEEQSSCNHTTPSAGQPMAVHGRTNKNQMGAMLLAFNSTPKSFQLLL